MRALFFLVFLGCTAFLGYTNRDLLQVKWEEWSGIASLRTDKASAESRLKSLEDEQVKMREAASDRDRLEEALRKLEREFTEYKEKYKTSMRSKAPGLEVGELNVLGKQYLNAKILGMTEDSISLSHSGGVVRVEKSGIPAELAARVALNQSTPIHQSVLSLLLEVEEHKTSPSTGSDASKPTPPWRSRFGGSISQADDEALRAVAIVSIATENASVTGSGFIARQQGKSYFFTSAHIAAQGANAKIRFIGGQSLKLPDVVEISDEPEADDLVRFEVSPPKGVTPLKLAVSPDDVAVDDKVVALGNSGGAGVIPVLRGKLKAFGPFAIEVDAEIIKGNSGGPVLLNATKTVIGVVARYESPNLHDIGVSQTQFAYIRRICLRPDQVSAWKTISVNRLVQEDNLIDRCVKNSYLLSLLFKARFTSAGVEGVDVSVFRRMGHETMGPALAEHLAQCTADVRRAGQIDRNRYASPAAVRRAVEVLHQSIQLLYSSDILGVDAKMMSHFHSAVFQDVAKLRAKMVVELEDHFKTQMPGSF